MVTVGDQAPEFIAPLVDDETEPTAFVDHLGDGRPHESFTYVATSSTYDRY